MNNTVKEFFEHSEKNPWGEILLVHCQAKDLKMYTEGMIPEVLQRVLQDPDWKNERSDDWANRGSSNDVFFLFKVWELWKSISRNGVKSPVHVHAVAGDNWLNFHPSNNKIEVLCEFFPEMEIKVLYHNYTFLHKNYPDEALKWYENHTHYPITTAEDYMELYGDLYASVEPDELELDFFWDTCKNITADLNYLSGKLKPRKRDWRYVDDAKFSGDPDYENSPFLTVSDRYHRVAMEKDATLLKDVIQVKPGKARFCGKWYDID